MATITKPNMFALKAETDLSTHQWKIVKFGSTDEVVVLCGAGERGIGVLANAPKAGEAAEIQGFNGGAKVKSVGVIAAGASFASDANGFAKAPTAAQFCLGVAMETAAANDIIGAELAPHYAPAS